MRPITAEMERRWLSGDYSGDRRPIARVTVQHPKVRLRNFTFTSNYHEQVISATSIPSSGFSTLGSVFLRGGKPVHNTYADILFSNTTAPKELPNVASVSWTRSVSSDTATCTVTLWNTEILTVGHSPHPGQLDRPGWYTPTRGASNFAARWGQGTNEWQNILLPDNIIRTYEGYGFDPDAIPEADENLVQTGVWLIDRVRIIAESKQIVLEMRDLGALLLGDFLTTPVVPKDFYPVTFRNWDGKVKLGARPIVKGGVKLTAETSSNAPWVASNTVYGHKLSYAFDANPQTYWLSVGNSLPSRRFAYEYVQATVRHQSVSEVRISTKKKGYIAYVSVMVGGVWQGTNTINYNEAGVGMNGGDIKYVKSKLITSENTVKITLPQTYAKVQRIRVTLGHLQDFGIGTYHYRAGIKNVEAYGPHTKPGPDFAQVVPGPEGANPGRYQDFTNIIKLLLAWGGFFWPADAYLKLSDGSTFNIHPAKNDDAVLGHGCGGRVWGDFQETGTAGPVPLGSDLFDKKSIMEAIAYIRDLLGFFFCIDETGGAQWRMPNVFTRGNWMTGTSGTPGRTTKTYTFDEETVLLSGEVNLSSENVRELIWIGDNLGKNTAVTPGYNPNPTGRRRIAVWTDSGFASKEEARVTGEMTALNQLFSYRTARWSIPGNPAIQIDDQVRVLEQVTSEGYLHYVLSVTSNLDMASGSYTYDMETHWLGYDPDASWILRLSDMSPAARDYIEGINLLPPQFNNRHINP